MLFLSFRYTLSKRYKFLPSFSVALAFCGVFISVCTLILVLSVMNGFKEDFEKLVIGTRPHITVYPQSVTFQNEYEVIETILNIREIKAVNKVINGEGVLSFSGKTSGVIIKGVEDAYFNASPLLSKSIIAGRLEQGGVVVGIELANKLGVNIGDTVTVLSSKMRKTLFGDLPVHKSYKVTGFFKVNMYIYDSSMLYLHLQDATTLLLDSVDPKVNALEIILDNAQKTEEVYKILAKSLIQYGGYITNWKNDNQSFIDAIATQTAVMSMILSLFLIISSFIIFSTLSSIINEKKRSMAIMQSFGMSSMEVMRVFITFGLIITIPAIIFGAIVGCVLSMNIENIKNWLETQTGTIIFDSAYYFLSYIPSSIHWGSVIKVCSFSVALCVISIVIPTIRSRKIMPHEALRFE